MIHYKNNNIWHNLLFVSEELFSKNHSIDKDYDDLIVLYDVLHKEMTCPLRYLDVIIRRWNEIPDIYQRSLQLKIQTMTIINDNLPDQSWGLIAGYRHVLSKSQWLDIVVHNEIFIEKNADIWHTLEDEIQMDIWKHSLFSQKPIVQSCWVWNMEQWRHCINHCLSERLLSVLHLNNDLEQLWKYVPDSLQTFVADEQLWLSLKKHQLLSIFDINGGLSLSPM